MQESKIKISMNEFKRLILEDAEKAKKESVYSTLLKNLKDVTDLTEKFYDETAFGDITILSEKDYKDISQNYEKLIDSCKLFLDNKKGASALEKKRVNMIKRLSNYLAMDMKQISLADTRKRMTYSDMMRGARAQKIDVGEKQLGTVGGNINSRIPLQLPDGTKGFFTKQNKFELREELEKIFHENEGLLTPEMQEKLLQGGYDRSRDDFISRVVLLTQNMKVDSDNEIEKSQTYNIMINNLLTLDKKVNTIEILKKLKTEKGYAEKMHNLFKQLADKYSVYTAMEIASIPNGSRLDQRNVAMSNVANLLGLNNIVAKSTEMQLVHNGQTIQGTFMEKADGELLDRLTSDSLMLQADQESFNNGPALKQISDMIVLDYLCGNTDRHMMNMAYKFKKDESGKVILAGIQGFDNDSSFGTRTNYSDKKPSGFITPVSQINTISASCYATVMNLNPEVLKMMLVDKLSTEELDALTTRLENLKTELKAEKIKVVGDHEWGQGEYTYDELSKTSCMMWNAMRKLPTIIQQKRNAALEQELEFTQGKQGIVHEGIEFDEVYRKINEFVSNVNDIKGVLHKDSKEFKNMLQHLKTVKEAGDELNKLQGDNAFITAQQNVEYVQKIKELGRACQKYMDAKELTQRTELGQKRFAFATEMRDFAQGELKIQENAIIKQIKEEGIIRM